MTTPPSDIDAGIEERASVAGHDLRIDAFAQQGRATIMSCDLCDAVVTIQHIALGGYKVDLSVVDRRCGT